MCLAAAAAAHELPPSSAACPARARPLLGDLRPAGTQPTLPGSPRLAGLTRTPPARLAAGSCQTAAGSPCSQPCTRRACEHACMHTCSAAAGPAQSHSCSSCSSCPEIALGARGYPCIAPLCCVPTASWEGLGQPVAPQPGRAPHGASPIPGAPAVTPCLSQGPPTGPSSAAPLPLRPSVSSDPTARTSWLGAVCWWHTASPFLPHSIPFALAGHIGHTCTQGTTTPTCLIAPITPARWQSHF